KELSRLGGGIGTRGPGEKKLETDRRHIRRQIRALTRQLEEIKKHRRLHQRRRKKAGVTQIALVGYTNAGKSTLLNRLTGANSLAENKLFATLDPISRTLMLPSGEQVILTDTVGFIRQLPHHLVAAFRSTLEQVKEADLLLHVVDASHKEAEEQIEAVEKVLEDLHASHLPTLLVLNKADLSSGLTVNLVDKEAISISAFCDDDLERLKEKMVQMLSAEMVIGTVEIPINRGDWIAALYEVAEVSSSRASDTHIQLAFRLSRKQLGKLPPALIQFARLSEEF
ncbi:MAG: GTPase HflX, partial [Thermoactinomyces sp.]